MHLGVMVKDINLFEYIINRIIAGFFKFKVTFKVHTSVSKLLLWKVYYILSKFNPIAESDLLDLGL